MRALASALALGLTAACGPAGAPDLGHVALGLSVPSAFAQSVGLYQVAVLDAKPCAQIQGCLAQGVPRDELLELTDESGHRQRALLFVPNDETEQREQLAGVPAGKARTFVVEALAPNADETFLGSSCTEGIEVKSGTNAAVTLASITSDASDCRAKLTLP
jgi:hypothetical protein